MSTDEFNAHVEDIAVSTLPLSITLASSSSSDNIDDGQISHITSQETNTTSSSPTTNGNPTIGVYYDFIHNLHRAYDVTKNLRELTVDMDYCLVDGKKMKKKDTIDDDDEQKHSKVEDKDKKVKHAENYVSIDNTLVGLSFFMWNQASLHGVVSERHLETGWSCKILSRITQEGVFKFQYDHDVTLRLYLKQVNLTKTRKKKLSKITVPHVKLVPAVADLSVEQWTNFVYDCCTFLPCKMRAEGEDSTLDDHDDFDEFSDGCCEDDLNATSDISIAYTYRLLRYCFTRVSFNTKVLINDMLTWIATEKPSFTDLCQNDRYRLFILRLFGHMNATDQVEPSATYSMGIVKGKLSDWLEAGDDDTSDEEAYVDSLFENESAGDDGNVYADCTDLHRFEKESVEIIYPGMNVFEQKIHKVS